MENINLINPTLKQLKQRTMEKPFEYFSIHKETKEVRYYSHPLFRPGRIGPDSYGEPKWNHWIDTRYKAKLRLFNYVHKMPPKTPYKPYEGTEIGKTIPILNF